MTEVGKSKIALALALVAVVGAMSVQAVRPASAATCPNTENLANSPIVQEFGTWMDREYGSFREFQTSAQLTIIGHALGRVASAVQGDPEREMIFACLETALMQWAAVHDPTIGPRRILEAAMGMQDENVARATGVRNTAPAFEYFDRLPPGLLVGAAAGAAANSPAMAASGAMALENGMDRRGSDYHSFWLDQARPELCRDACAGDPKCRAFTYVLPGVQGSKAKCWLKTAVPNAVPNGCCVSGVKSVAAGGQGGQAGPGARAVAGTPSATTHPWDGLCVDKILEAGYRPIFKQWTNYWSVRIFADPISNEYVSVDGCNRKPFDMAEFHRYFEYDSTEYHDYARSAEFFKTEVWRPRPGVNGDWTRLSYYR